MPSMNPEKIQEECGKAQIKSCGERHISWWYR